MLYAIRSIFNIPIKDLSYFTKIPTSTLSSYDSEITIPSKDNLSKLCNFFGLEEKFFTTKGINGDEYYKITDAKKLFIFNNFGRNDEDNSLNLSDLLNKRKEIMDSVDLLNSKHMEYINKMIYCLNNQDKDIYKELLNTLDSINVTNENINIIYQEYLYRIKDKDIEKVMDLKDKIQDILKSPDYNTNKLLIIRFNKKTGDIKKGYYFYVDGCRTFGSHLLFEINKLCDEKYRYDLMSSKEYKIKVNWQHNNKFSDRITLFKDGKNDYAEILEDWSVV
jgi:hypothetical protein